MKYLFVLLIAIVLIAGCTTPQETPISESSRINTSTPLPVTTTIETTIPTTIHTPVSTTEPTTIKTTIPTPTQIPKDVTNIDDITFTTWSNGILSMDYPNTWTVFKITEVETGFTPPSKAVTYSIIIYKIDVGSWRTVQTPEWAYEQVQAAFPQYSARSITGIDTYCTMGGLATQNCFKYTVTTPEIKQFRYFTVSSNYNYVFMLSSPTPVKYDEYENLGVYMTNTIRFTDSKN